MARCLFSNFIKIIGIMDAIPKISPATTPLKISDIDYFLRSYACLSQPNNSLSTSLTDASLTV